MENEKATCLLFIGMAGTGKSSLLQRLNSHIKQKKYTINLDPAIANLPFNANIDIRDTVDFKQVMKQYKLGPNGGILTALNLFTTKFDQVLDLVEKKNVDYVLVDTPGQIEIFTWSASDVVDPSFCSEWMQDFQVFQQQLDEEGYMSSLVSSMCLVLEEFYQNLDYVGVSAVTGEGMEDLVLLIEKKRKEYKEEYLPFIEAQIKRKNEKEQEKRKQDLDKLINDLKIKK
ncbi:hypothetical protein HDV06_005847 [Boothiomyces sp. JEL0866]|nr:hypothetical protein HDV06_005847 [Boothiomyces sp. JEL0866]